MEFEWDPEKAESNLRKHGVSFHEAATAFGDSLSITFYDPDHSGDEDRYITIGMSSDSRLMIVSHTDRGDNIRVISARTASRRERKTYEDG
ncbi:MAG: BrnT family toxin [Planctomycetes bacterium]|nr:BrnT family toxin [Planctomycetota bacterium]